MVKRTRNELLSARAKMRGIKVGKRLLTIAESVVRLRTIVLAAATGKPFTGRTRWLWQRMTRLR